MPAPAFSPKALASLMGAVCLTTVPSSCRTLEPDPEEPGVISRPVFALIDLDGDDRVSPAEMAKFKHREGLAEFDLNDDGEISLLEWKSAKPTARDSEASFRQLDRDDDGIITEEEAMLSICELPPFREGFRQMDANGDGHLHWEEYAAGDVGSLNVNLFSTPPAPSPAPH